jgi:hypothetical protein
MESYYYEATANLTFVKFCESGMLLTGSEDKRIRLYIKNNSTMNYDYKTSFGLYSYGYPTSATCKNNEGYVVVGAGNYLVML